MIKNTSRVQAKIGDIVVYQGRKWLWFTSFAGSKALLVLEKGERAFLKNGKERDNILAQSINLYKVGKVEKQISCEPVK